MCFGLGFCGFGLGCLLVLFSWIWFGCFGWVFVVGCLCGCFEIFDFGFVLVVICAVFV